MKNIAIVDNKHSILFSELSGIVCKTAQYYFDKGVTPFSKVAILGYNSAEYVIAIYSIWKLGAIPVPINIRLKDIEINSILKSAQCSNIIVDRAFQNVEIDLSAIEMNLIIEGANYKFTHDVFPNDTAVIIHTSGSSGMPKGVETTNENLYHSYLSVTDSFHFLNSDVFLASLPFYHIGGFSIINRAILSGGMLVIPKSLKHSDIAYSMIDDKVSVVSLVPTMLKRIINDGIKPNKELRCLFLGGGASSNNLIYSATNLKWPIIKVYGSSETTAMVTACWGNDLSLFPNSAGKTLSGVLITILDNSYNEVEIGVVGEIAIKSKTIAKGYLNLSTSWSDKIHNGYYLSGDYGYLDETKKLFVVARRTDLIVSGGENIDPREIESILNEHPNILESFVFPIEDKEWGEIPVALIVLNNNSITKIQIVDYLRLNIASYKIPKNIQFINTIPKTELGKVNINVVKNIFNNLTNN